MDEDWLDEETEHWVEEGIISAEQARTIRARYGLEKPGDQSDSVRRGSEHPKGGDDESAPEPRGRIVTALSLMGAALIGVGILVFLIARWDTMARPLRLVILFGSTVGFLGSGYELRHHRSRPYAGHALLGIGAVAIGVTLFASNDMYSVTASTASLYALWSVLALAVAHGVRSRPIVLIGIITGLAAVGDGIDGSPVVHIGLVALSIYGLSLLVEESTWSDLSGAYRVGSVGGTIAMLLVFLVDDVNLSVVAPDRTAVLLVLFVTATATVVGTSVQTYRGKESLPTAAWTATVLLVIAVTTFVSLAAPAVFPDLVRVLVWNGMVLGAILSTVWLGYAQRSPVLVNGAVVAFLVQLVFVLVSTVLQAVSASVALIVGGIVLLGAGVALERGRRELLDRMQSDGPHEG